MITCELCGTKNPDKALYCQNCGERIRDKDGVEIQKHIDEMTQLCADGEMKKAFKEFEKAVLKGWNGDYYLIAQGYASELFADEKDSIKKAYKWFERFYSDFRAGRIEYKLLCNTIDGLYSGIDIRIRYAWEAADHKEKESIMFGLTEIYESILSLVTQNDCNKIFSDEEKRKTSDILLSVGESTYYGLILHGKWGEFEIPVNVKQAFQAFEISAKMGNKRAKMFIDEMRSERIVRFKKPLTKKLLFGDELSDYCFLDVDADDGLIEKDEGYFRLISRMIQVEEFTVSSSLYTDIEMGYIRKGLDKLLSELGEDEYDVMKYIYGLDYEDPLSYRATAVMLDIPYTKIIEIEERVIKKLQACKQTKLLRELLLENQMLESRDVDYSEMFEEILNKEISEFLCNNDVETEGFLSKAVIERYSSRIKKLNGKLNQVRGLNENVLKRVSIKRLYELLILSDEEFMEVVETLGHPVPRHAISRLRSRNQDLMPIAFGLAQGNGNQFNVKDMFAASEEMPITRTGLSFTTIEQLLKRGYLFISDMTKDVDWSILNENKELIAYLCCGGDKMKRIYISSSLDYYMHRENIDSLSDLKKKYGEMPWNLQQQAIKVLHHHNMFKEMKYEKPEDIGERVGTIPEINLYEKTGKESSHMGVYSLWNNDLSQCICAFNDYDYEDLKYIARKINANGSEKNGFFMSRKELENMYELTHEDEVICAIHDYNCANGITEYEVLP